MQMRLSCLFCRVKDKLEINGFLMEGKKKLNGCFPSSSRPERFRREPRIPGSRELSSISGGESLSRLFQYADRDDLCHRLFAA